MCDSFHQRFSEHIHGKSFQIYTGFGIQILDTGSKLSYMYILYLQHQQSFKLQTMSSDGIRVSTSLLHALSMTIPLRCNIHLLGPVTSEKQQVEVILKLIH